MLSENLKRLRNEKGYTQQEFADRLNVVRQTVSKWEKGLSVPDSEMLLKISEILETPIGVIMGEKTEDSELTPKKVRHKPTLLEVILLVLGSPIWLSLAVTVIAVIISLYAVLWSVIISLWAVFASLIGCAIGGILSGVHFLIVGNLPSGIAVIGAGIVCMGLSVFMFFGSKAATKGIVILTKKLAIWTKNCFVKKEEA